MLGEAGTKQLIGKSPALLNCLKRIPIAAHCDVTVLLLGETGTGKELFHVACHGNIELTGRRDRNTAIGISSGELNIKHVGTTTNYTHVLNKGGRGIRSPLDN